MSSLSCITLIKGDLTEDKSLRVEVSEFDFSSLIKMINKKGDHTLEVLPYRPPEQMSVTGLGFRHRLCTDSE